MAHVSTFTIPESSGGERLDSALFACGAFPTRSAAAKAIEQGLVLVNGKPALKRTMMREGDVIVVAEPQAAPAPLHEEIPLDIRYEDEHLLVLSKQVGLVCHRDDKYTENTLSDALIRHCGIDHLCNLQGDDDRPGIVHRLDKNTSGLMMAAKTDEAGEALMAAMQSHAIDRRYLALVHGGFTSDSGIIDAPISRSLQDRKKMAVRDCPQSREATTSFKVLARLSSMSGEYPYSLIECRLHTGRTHQIRVHLEFANHPLVGETHYASGSPKRAEAQLGLQRQFLHSFFLRFTHPVTGEELVFWDNLPDDLAEALGRADMANANFTARGIEVREELSRAPHPAIRGEL